MKHEIGARTLIGILYAMVGGVAGVMLTAMLILLLWDYRIPVWSFVLVWALCTGVGYRTGQYVAASILPEDQDDG